jgi:hypothetical protein
MTESEKLDTEFVKIIESLIEKSKFKELLFLDPLKDNPNKILRLLTKGSAIKNP